MVMTIVGFTVFWFAMIAAIITGPEVTRKFWK